MSQLLIALILGCFANLGAAAGMSTVLVPPSGKDNTSLEVLVWIPCKLAPLEIRMGPMVVSATKDCAVAGQPLPLIVISHGQGGTRLSHHDTAASLADAGFIVASFNHPGDSFGDDSATNKVDIFESRPANVSHVISHMIENWKDRSSINPEAVGVFGFSRGGYTALALAGAVPSAAASASRFCSFWRSFGTPICRQLDVRAVSIKAQADHRVKAIVAVDALNLFDSSSFSAVKVPVQLWASELGGAGVKLEHAQLLRDWLPQASAVTVAKGAGHFVFLAPCSEALRREAREICDDPKGFDRKQWHAMMNTAVTEFFIRTLRMGSK